MAVWTLFIDFYIFNFYYSYIGAVDISDFILDKEEYFLGGVWLTFFNKVLNYFWI